MSRRILALVLFAVAACIWLFAFVPARRERDSARAGYAGARQQRQQQRVRLVSLQRRVAAVPEAGAAGARAVRSALLAATRDLPVRGVALDATGVARGPASGHLTALGRSSDMIALAERLAAPGSGVRPRRIGLASDLEDGAPIVRFSAELTGAGGWP